MIPWDKSSGMLSFEVDALVLSLISESEKN
jgi:hypothetical protein